MPKSISVPPDFVPILSRGKHRNPRKGACFMEFASYLAGERWSDQPKCTHPLLAALARDVNDYISDSARQRLLPLVPSVIGTAVEAPIIDLRIAVRCATVAMPIAAETRQRAMAVAILTCDRYRRELISADPSLRNAAVHSQLRAQIRAALTAAPEPVAWARKFTGELRAAPLKFRQSAAPRIVHSAVQGIAEACVPDPDATLFALLDQAITDVRQLIARPVAVPGAVKPHREGTGRLER